MTTITTMKIGKAIAQIRNERDLTLDDLADMCDISKASLSRIEAEKQWPTRETLGRIAHELGVCAYQLFAIAEGKTIPVPHETPKDLQLRQALEAMEPESRYLVESIAEKLAKTKK